MNGFKLIDQDLKINDMSMSFLYVKENKRNEGEYEWKVEKFAQIIWIHTKELQMYSIVMVKYMVETCSSST